MCSPCHCNLPCGKSPFPCQDSMLLKPIHTTGVKSSKLASPATCVFTRTQRTCLFACLCRYELYGVITHQGLNLDNGHYVAYIKAPRGGDDLEPDCVIEARERVSTAVHRGGDGGFSSSVDRLGQIVNLGRRLLRTDFQRDVVAQKKKKTSCDKKLCQEKKLILLKVGFRGQGSISLW